MANPKTIITDKSGYTYDKESGVTYDENGEFAGSDIPTTKSDKMIKLQLQATVAFRQGDHVLGEKIRKKIDALKIAESPFLYSTPEYCYTYVLYKLRKVAGYSQEVMAFSMSMPLSTYIKIENRILKPSLHNIILASHVFKITAKEMAELYSLIEGFVYERGKLIFSSENTNLKEVEYTTPIDLYESKMLKEEYDYIDTKFREIYLEGRKRQMEIDKKQKERDEAIQQQEEEDAKLSFDEIQDREHMDFVEQIKADDEARMKQEQLIQDLKDYHGSKYNYSL